MSYDLIIIGSGPAGYVAAIKAGQTGLKTLVIDKQYVGGMCLNWGCIPTKSLLESAKFFKKISANSSEFGIEGIEPDKLSFNWAQAQKRSQTIVTKLTRGIEYLWKKNAIEFLKAEATIVSPTKVKAAGEIHEARNIIIATGSRPAPQQLFHHAIEIDELLKMDSLPHKPVLHGRGAILAELAQFFKYIDRQPIIVQSDSPLIPGLDPYLEAFMIKRLKKDKIDILQEDKVTIQADSIKHGENYYSFDAVINCSLRKAVLPDMEIELELKNGFMATDDHLRTSVPTIFAAGDVNGISYLAHAASAQALKIVSHLNGVDNDSSFFYPINIYTEPELAQIGLTETQLKDLGQEYLTREFGFNANGKALAEGSSEGFIRLLFEPKYHQVMGVQIAGSNATDLISEAAVLMQLEGTVYDLANAVHAHPTIAEVFMDVARE